MGERYVEGLKVLVVATACLFAPWAGAATTDLSGSGAWTALLKGVNFDPYTDTQAAKAGTEIVGNSTHPSFYINYDDNGTTGGVTGDDILSIRVRIGDETKSTHSAYAFSGIDANGDGKLDVFISSGGGNTAIWAPGADANTSPSTTSVAGAASYTYPQTSANYNFAVVSALNDPHWDGNNDLSGDGKIDVFISFSVPVSDLSAFLATKGIIVTQSTQMRFVSLTATQTNALNSDFNGIDGKTNWTQTFDQLGIFSDPVTSSGVVDATPPATPTVNNLTTNDATPTLTGTYDSTDAAGGFTVTVNGVIYTLGDGHLSAAGNAWTLNVPTALTSATYDVTATATDAFGNTSSDATSGELVIDATPPATPTVNNLTTSDPTPTLTGTYDAADAAGGFTVTVDGVVYTLGDGHLSAAGNDWSLTIPTALAHGPYSVFATATDGLGNAATDTSINELVIDTVAPAVPTVNSLTTSNPMPTLTGIYASTDAAGGFTVSVNGVVYALGGGHLSAAGNTWMLTIPTALASATYDVTATATDAVGNTRSDVTSSELVIDTTPPAAPTVNSLTTNDPTPILTGTYDATDAAGGFTATVNGVIYALGGGQLSAAGNIWTLTIPTTLASATYDVTATATDAVGNASSDITSGELVIDTTAPATPTVNNLTTNDPTPILTGTYDAADAAGGFTVTVNGVVYALGGGHLSAAGNDWTLTIPTALASATYHVTATAVDPVGNVGSDMTSGELVIDTTPPAAPTVNNLTTSDPTPTLTGTYDAADAAGGFTVTVNGVVYALGGGHLSAAGNAWTLTIPIALASAPYDVTATAVDAVGNAGSDVTSGELVIDTAAPSAPTVNSRVTNDPTPTLTGTYDAADAEGGFTVSVNGVVYALGGGHLSAAGNAWTLTIPTALASATYDVIATATDAVGNASSDTTSGELVIDATAPATPTVNSLTTNDPTPTLTGTYDAADAAGGFTVSVNGVVYALGGGHLSAAGNAWTLTIPTALVSAIYDVTARASDAFGNSSSDLTDGELMIDTLPPARPTVNSLATNDTTPTLAGTFASADAAGGFTVSVNGVVYALGGGQLSAAGNVWTLAVPTALGSATYDVTATATDAFGNASSDATSGELVIDATAPAAPTVNSLTTNDTTPTLTGTYDAADAAGGFTVSVNAVIYTLGGGDLSAVGNTWTLTVPAALASATYDVTATATDVAGNAGSDLTGGELVIDATAPAIPTVNNLTTNDPTPTLTGTYDAADAAGGFTVTVDGVVYTLGDGHLSAAGNDWSLTIPTALANGPYSVFATATDLHGNAATDASINELVIDTVAPAAPTVNSLTTNNPMPTLTGIYASTDAAGGFTVSVNGVVYALGGGHLSAAGNTWTLTIPTALASATYDVTATATDAVGNTRSDVTSSELVIDTTPPAAPTVNSLTTNDPTPILTGTYDAADAAGGFTVSVNGVAYALGGGDLIASGNVWTLVIPSELPEATYDVSAAATDAAGNMASDTTSGELVIDTTAPAVPTVNNLTTNDPTPTLTGTYDATDAAGGFAVSVNGVVYALGGGHLSAASNNWSLTIPAGDALNEGPYSVVATSVDSAGNSVSDLNINELVVDLTAPALPTVNSVITADTTPTMTGTYVASDAAGGFAVTLNGVTYVPGDGHLTTSGNVWTLIIPTALAQTTYDVTATATDLAGNARSDITGGELIISPDSDGDGIADAADLDDDNDGIPDAVEDDGSVDTDGDGIPDSRDLDSDNDGIADVLESGIPNAAALDTDRDGRIDAGYPVGSNGLADLLETSADNGTLAYTVADTDNDGVDDFRDLDSDNDGIHDVIEAGGSDPDGDGVVGSGAPPVDAGGIPAGGGLTTRDSDNDGAADFRDLDSDGDGIYDVTEAGGSDPDGDGVIGAGIPVIDAHGLAGGSGLVPTDSNGDGTPDYLDTTDSDGDGVPDTADLDDDNDGIPDAEEGDATVDTDGDGVPDSLDLDSDNDGIDDLLESGLADAGTLDADHDGRIDASHTVGGNGLANVVETGVDSGGIAYTLADSDGDGVADFRDLDSDNDAIHDVIENGGGDPDHDGVVGEGTPVVDPSGLAGGAGAGVRDSDSDGVGDFRDRDSDNDGLYDVIEAGGSDGDNDGVTGVGVPAVNADGQASGAGLTPPDGDGDGVEEFRDRDSDNDGIPDVIEAGGADADGDGVLGSGVPGVDVHGLPAGGGLSPVDTDDDTVPDQGDLDTDGDGLSDFVEAGGADADGDGQVDGFVDADGDGFDDGAEARPLPLPDGDGDGIPDFRDADDADHDGIADTVDRDDDNDGIPDEEEGDGQADTDADGVPDSRDLDSDNDGIFDLDESGIAGARGLDADNDGRIDVSHEVGANGLADGVETNPDSGVMAYAVADSDGDGVADFRDRDSDNDGIYDVVEAGSSDPDGDGRPGSGEPPVNPDGVPGGGLMPRDTDGDAVADFRDLDTDNDGIPDVVEAGRGDVDFDARIDEFVDANQDGVDDRLVGAPVSLPDTDGDGEPDVRDLDSDDDGIADVVEAGGTGDFSGKLANFVDVNGDGYDDQLASHALSLSDVDGDGIPDYRDPPDEAVEPSRIKTGVQGLGGCTIAADAPFDPVLAFAVLMSLLALARGRLRVKE